MANIFTPMCLLCFLPWAPTAPTMALTDAPNVSAVAYTRKPLQLEKGTWKKSDPLYSIIKQPMFFRFWSPLQQCAAIQIFCFATSGPSEACTISSVGKGPTDLTNLAMSVKCHAFLNVAQPFVFLEGRWPWRKRTASTIEEEEEGDCTMLKITNRNSFLGIYGYQWNTWHLVLTRCTFWPKW